MVIIKFWSLSLHLFSSQLKHPAFCVRAAPGDWAKEIREERDMVLIWRKGALMKSITQTGTEEGVTPIVVSVKRVEGCWQDGREGQREDTMSESETDRYREIKTHYGLSANVSCTTAFVFESESCVKAVFFLFSWLDCRSAASHLAPFFCVSVYKLWLLKQGAMLLADQHLPVSLPFSWYLTNTSAELHWITSKIGKRHAQFVFCLESGIHLR